MKKRRFRKFNEKFRKFAVSVSELAGSPWAFMFAIALVGGWALSGNHFQWSEGHSLFINSATTICTFFLVFIIQNSQNRDGKAVQVKLDAIIAGLSGTSNKLIDLQNQAEEELDEAVEEIKALRDEG